MLVGLAMALAVSPAVVDMRSSLAELSWRGCVNNFYEQYTAQPNVSKDAAINFAFQTCYIMGDDFKRTLPDVVTLMLNKQGTTSFGPDVVETLVDETFARVKDRMQKDALSGDLKKQFPG